ncbi:MAG: SAM-dependent methyltransferase [Candidatus Eisenbacteria bacterium]
MFDPEEFTARARAHWTKERVTKVTAGRDYPIDPAEGALLLRALGLLNADASMSADAVKKFGQINHLVTMLEPSILELTKQIARPSILDAGCGSSYLTFLLAWCFARRWSHPADIFGIDSNPRLIEKCRERARLAGLEGLRFEAIALEAVNWSDLAARHLPAPPESARETSRRPHAVFALHACDTATDQAIALGIKERADLIAVAPCCQAELARAWARLAAEHRTGAFAPLWHSPQLRRESAATVTDMMRVLLLRGAGYEVTAQEFVPSSHTPKNTLIRAVRRGSYWLDALKEYRALRAATGDESIVLESLLPAEHRARLDGLA